MAIRREDFNLELSDKFIGRLQLMQRATWHFAAPRDPLWGVPADSGPGPHLWDGDQA